MRFACLCCSNALRISSGEVRTIDYKGIIKVNYMKVFLMCTILISCGDKTTSEPTPNNRFLQIANSSEIKEISEVSGIAGVIFFDMSINKELNCIAKDSAPSGEGLKKGAEEERMFNRIFQRFANKCIFFSTAIKTTEPVYKIIRNEKRMPGNLYVFSIYLPQLENSDDLFAEHQIGFFPNEISCVSVEALARDYEIPSTKCKKWDNEF